MALVPGPPAPGSAFFKYRVGQRVLCRIIEKCNGDYLALLPEHNVKCAYSTARIFEVGDEVYAVIERKSSHMFLLVDAPAEEPLET